MLPHMRIRIEVDGDDEELLNEAAEDAGMPIAAYVRDRALAAARHEKARTPTYDAWLWCPSCGDVINDREGTLDAPSTPAPCCGSTDVRAIWPNEHVGLLEVAWMDLSDPTHVRAAVVFLGAALEALLGEVLGYTLRAYRTHPAVIDLTQGEWQGLKDRLDAYKGLVGRSAKEVLQDARRGAWFDDWATVAKARNKFGHGGWFAARPGELEALVRRVHDGAQPAMVVLHNAAMAEVRKRTGVTKLFEHQ